MYEYHGWFCIAVAPHEVEDEDCKLYEVVNYVKNLIEQTLPEHHIAELKPINGEYMASFAGFANHRSSLADNLIRIFQEIAQKAPGSYGLLYVWDDEDSELGNEFQVGRLARGEFKFVKDSYLFYHLASLQLKTLGSEM